MRSSPRGRVPGPSCPTPSWSRRPPLSGGLEELVRSASAFPTLDLGLLGKVLQRYDLANLWAATGWFLERFRETFHVPEGVLARIGGHRPCSPQYLERGRRGGR